MKRFLAFVSAALACAVMVGCAHPITMNPDLALLKPTPGASVIPKDVGYYIADANRSLQITTPGGGGDKVSYFPYRDIEPGLYKALAEVFRSVSKIQNPGDRAALKKSGISLLITPDIKTTSFSESIVTWPPTLFTVTLDCAITDTDGQLVQRLQVSGEGRATFSEFAGNLSLSAVRASNDALAKLIKALSESPALRK